MKLLTEDLIDRRIQEKKAHIIKSDAKPLTLEDEIIIKALPELEQQIWIMHRNGLMNKTIAELLDLRQDVICRLLKGIKEKFQYLADFRAVLTQYPNHKDKFYNITNCNRKTYY